MWDSPKGVMMKVDSMVDLLDFELSFSALLLELSLLAKGRASLVCNWKNLSSRVERALAFENENCLPTPMDDSCGLYSLGSCLG